MRDPKRIDGILQELSNIWHKCPDMRLGQLIGNVLEGVNLYYVEDSGFINALKDAYGNETAPVNFDEEAYIFDLIKKHPDELGFVLQEKDYEAYKNTYVGAKGTEEEVELSEQEFNNLKKYFNSLKE